MFFHARCHLGHVLECRTIVPSFLEACDGGWQVTSKDTSTNAEEPNPSCQIRCWGGAHTDVSFLNAEGELRFELRSLDSESVEALLYGADLKTIPRYARRTGVASTTNPSWARAVKEDHLQPLGY